MTDIDILNLIRKAFTRQIRKVSFETFLNQWRYNDYNSRLMYSLSNDNKLIALFLNGENSEQFDYKLIQHLKELKYLSLINFKINDISFVSNLGKLEGLSFKNNEIENVAPLVELRRLRVLNLSTNKINGISQLKFLKNIVDLNLSYNLINDIYSLNALKSLTILDLKRNYIFDITALYSLINLKNLDISNNNITDGSSLSDLNKLTVLKLNSNQLVDVSFLKNLTYLQHLELLGNIIDDISSINNLILLRHLDLANNKISDISSIANLKSLIILSLTRNKLKDISPLGKLTGLYILDLNSNDIIDITPLKNLKKLISLGLSNNPIFNLPEWITDFNMKVIWDQKRYVTNSISLFNYSLKTPPIEIVKQGKNAIRAWFEGSRVNVDEIKVLLVGHGEVGKTTLVKCLTGEKPDPKEPATHNIKITQHTIKYKNKNIKLNYWDFGGQEVMHSTHQFFLSKNSIYILVLDGRRDEDAEYWLKHIESFGGNSPVIVVLNKTDSNPAYDVNRQFLKQKFPFIQGFYKTVCLGKIKGIKEFKKGFKEALSKVKIINQQWPKEWFKIKEVLENLKDDYISERKYNELCTEKGILDNNTKEILAGFLNDLGVIVHFKDLRLTDLHILNPRWVSRAAYKIINSKKVSDNHGLLKEEWLSSIMKKKCKDDFTYKPSNFPYIIELMRKFELCYSLDNNQYLIPELMDIQQPKIPKNSGSILKFYLKYEDLLPTSIMHRFIVRMHEDIKDNLRWRTGVVLEIPIFNSTAVIIADLKDKKINIEISGKRVREHFAVIRKTFDSLNSTFEKLNVTEWIPLPDKSSFAVEYEELIGLEELGKEFIEIGKLKKRYNVKELLNGIEQEYIRKREYEWGVFLCHSSNDKKIVKKIALDLLNKENISYWLDEEQIKSGESIIDKITDGLQKSFCIVPCISKSQLESGWSRKEYQSILYKVISGTSRQKILPLIIDDTTYKDVPLFLNDLLIKRYRNKTEYKEFLDDIKNIIRI